MWPFPNQRNNSLSRLTCVLLFFIIVPSQESINNFLRCQLGSFSGKWEQLRVFFVCERAGRKIGATRESVTLDFGELEAKSSSQGALSLSKPIILPKTPAWENAFFLSGKSNYTQMFSSVELCIRFSSACHAHRSSKGEKRTRRYTCVSQKRRAANQSKSQFAATGY